MAASMVRGLHKAAAKSRSRKGIPDPKVLLFARTRCPPGTTVAPFDVTHFLDTTGDSVTSWLDGKSQWAKIQGSLVLSR